MLDSRGGAIDGECEEDDDDGGEERLLEVRIEGERVGDTDDEEGEMGEASGKEGEGLDDVRRTVEGVTRKVARDDDDD